MCHMRDSRHVVGAYVGSLWASRKWPVPQWVGYVGYLFILLWILDIYK